MTESEYYATEMTDLDIDRQADAGDYLNEEACAEDVRYEDECDEDGNYVPTLHELLAEQRRAAGKPPFRASIQ